MFSSLSQALFGTNKELETPIQQLFGEYQLGTLPQLQTQNTSSKEKDQSEKEVNLKTQQEEEVSESGYESGDESEEIPKESQIPDPQQNDLLVIEGNLDEEEEDEEEAEEPKPQKEKFKPGETPQMREKRTIFVGNVPVAIKKNGLEKIFKQYGKIDSIRFRAVGYSAERKPMIGKISKGTIHEFNDTKNAYIVFSEIESANAALAANNTVVNNNHLRVDSAGESTKKDTKNCVFVGNLPRETKEESLREHFEKAVGPVVSVRIIRDRNHINCKGFGFIKFRDQVTFKACLGLDKQTTYRERVLTIVAAKKMDNPTRPKSPANSRSFIFERKVKDIDDGLYGAERRIKAKKEKKEPNISQDNPNHKRKRTDDGDNNDKRNKRQKPNQHSDPTQKYKRYQKKIRSFKKK